MLDLAGVALQADIFETLRARDLLNQSGGIARLDTRAAHARVDVDEDFQFLSSSARHRIQPRSDLGVVAHRHQLARPRIQRHEPRDSRFADYWRGDQDRFDAAFSQRFSLAELGAADAERAGPDLEVRNGDRFVGLGVRAQRNGVLLRMRRHMREIALQCVKIEN